MNDQKFINYLEQKVKKTIRDYKLCTKKDKLVVACSGGKDSTVVLYLLHKFGYQVEGMIIDLLIGKWSEENLENTKTFCQKENIKLNIIDMRKEFGCSMCFIRAKVQAKQKLSNCMVCGVIKRWLMNKKARELKGKKLVTGHNLDDGAETVMMNLLKGNLELGMGGGPETGVVRDKKFVPRI
ncbi:tRNA 2-thiocytidine biosynthesis protein TtcA, partial [Candidatus Woesearchaeota archaeon]|nr:tRNA 2-thiocytidine biosynthesis protein TtcA [Candidatus Woesearchaeota archaeon]